MQVENDKVVSFTYTILDEQNSTIESSEQGVPMAFLCGKHNILPALETAMLGKTKGETFDVTLEPKDAYGERREDATQKVPVKHLASKHKRLLPGTFVKVNTDKGVVDASVIKAGKFMVTLDLNHPFAGKVLTFRIEITDIRDASEDEIAHGHAHGIGGHHH